MKIYKVLILKKIGLSTKFPRQILYARKAALGVEIMKPSTTINILVIKLYIGHQRKKSRLATFMNINEEILFLNNGVSKDSIEISYEKRFWEYS